MSEVRDEKSFGELETLRSECGGEASDGERSLGERETLRDEGWGILGEWEGKRWKVGEEILGRYVVERELGQGGMGVVYECMDKVGGIRVAVKALPPELSHNSVEMEEVRENFELVYKLSHPNIASVKTLERDGKGEYFLVMEVAEGESLRKWIRRKRKEGGVELEDAIPILRQVAGALDYAHGERVVHRDVKPGNVMIDGRGRVKVLDFGLAAQIRTSLSRASRAYRGTSGTGPYMAPEQWEGKQQDGKADQYALGVMAYEMLAGHLPFENSELSVLKEAVLHGEAEAVPGLPRGAMGALRRAMAKRKEERFGSCGEFLEALSGKGGRRNARGKTLAGWVAVMVLAGSGAWWGMKQTARPEGSPQQEAGMEETSGEPPAPPEKIEEEERVRAEREGNDALEESVYQLAPVAKTKLEREVRKKHDFGQGFGEKLREAQQLYLQGETAVQGRNFRKAEEYFESSLAASGWVATNAALRSEATLAREAAGNAKREASMMEGERLAVAAWQMGEEAMAKAEAAWEKVEFRAATEGWNEAGTAYGESAKAARTAKVAQGMDAARGAKGRGAWKECLKAAEGVLALDGGNAEAKNLKAEAVGQIENARKAEEAEKRKKEEEEEARRREAERKAEERRKAEEAKQAEEKAAKTPKAGDTRTIALPGGATMEMVWCPPGTFMMGSPQGEKGRDNDETQHRVTLTKGFWMAKTEVTQKQWESVMGTSLHYQNDLAYSVVFLYGEGDDYPMYYVDWSEAQEFCEKAGLRLPTEAEWEYACRAGSTGAYGGTGRLEDMGWHGHFIFANTHPVGQKQPNAWGLHDMHGNVCEWCADWYQKDFGSREVTDPNGPDSGSRRVCRGGGFHSRSKHCRSASRGYYLPGDRDCFLGFRPVKTGP